MPRLRPTRTLGLALLAALLVAPAARADRVPTIDDVLSVKRVGSPAISPDGARVAFTARETNWDENAWETEIWLADAASGDVRQLTNAPGSSSSPAWAPDGSRLAFISDRAGTRQIYLIDPRAGEARVLTSTEEGVAAFAWSPDGTRIAFTTMDPKSDAMKARGERYGEIELVDEEHRMTHLHVVDVAAREVRRLTSGAFTVGAFDWSPDGRAIAFDHRPNPDAASSGDADISVVTVATGAVTPLVTQPGPDANPRWSPDGAAIAFETAMAHPFFYYANGRVAVVAAGGGPPRVLAQELDEDPSLVAWRQGGLYVWAADRTWARLWRVDPATGRATRLGPAGAALATSFSIDREGRRAAFLQADATRLADVWIADLPAFAARRLTDFHDQIRGWTIGTREIVRWTSTDGTEIEGVLHKPADFTPGRRYPLLVVIHGGPTGISRPVPLPSSVYPIERWLARGALVLEPNYRGSGGYGEAFRSLNVRNLGIGDAWDVLSGIDHLVAQGMADPARVGAMGWSQGGYISAFLTTRHSDRFKAISVGAGISNWVTYYVNTDIHPFTRQYLKATPWDDPEVYAKTSPMTYIRQAKTPTLIQHGEQDRRVPIPNAFELYQGLRDHGVPVRLAVFKGFGHGLNKPKAARAAMEQNEEWFGRHLFGEAAPTAASR